MANATKLERGELIAGRYRLHRRLEREEVVAWAATHRLTARPVELTFVAKPTADVVDRSIVDSRALRGLRHAQLAPAVDVFALDHWMVVVSDQLDGSSLRAFLREQGRLDSAAAARLLLPVVSALGNAHALGIVHGALDLDSVFVRSNGVPVVRDFRFDSEAYTAADHLADVRALGAILLEVVGATSQEAPPVELAAAGSEVPVDITALAELMASDGLDDLREASKALSFYSDTEARPFGRPGSVPRDAASPAELQSTRASSLAISSVKHVPRKGTEPLKMRVARVLAIAAATGVCLAGFALREIPAKSPKKAPSAAASTPISMPAPSASVTSAAHAASASAAPATRAAPPP